jgi:hypothetical protein
MAAIGSKDQIFTMILFSLFDLYKKAGKKNPGALIDI